MATVLHASPLTKISLVGGLVVAFLVVSHMTASYLVQAIATTAPVFLLVAAWRLRLVRLPSSWPLAAYLALTALVTMPWVLFPADPPHITYAWALWHLLPPLALFFIRFSPRIWDCVTALALVNAALVIWHFREIRPSGLAHDPNTSAALMLLGAVHLLNTRVWWLSMPLFAGIVATGSRAVLLASLAVVLLGVARKSPVWALLLICAGALTLWYAEGSQLLQRLDLDVITADMMHRGALEGWGLRWGLYVGVVVGVGWLLYKGRASTLLVVLLLISVIDNYTWVWAMGWAWWLTLASPALEDV